MEANGVGWVGGEVVQDEARDPAGKVMQVLLGHGKLPGFFK